MLLFDLPRRLTFWYRAVNAAGGYDSLDSKRFQLTYLGPDHSCRFSFMFHDMAAMNPMLGMRVYDRITDVQDPVPDQRLAEIAAIRFIARNISTNVMYEVHINVPFDTANKMVTALRVAQNLDMQNNTIP